MFPSALWGSTDIKDLCLNLFLMVFDFEEKYQKLEIIDSWLISENWESFSLY